MKHLFLMLLCIAVMFSCKEEESIIAEEIVATEGVFVRAENGSQFDFQDFNLMGSEMGEIKASEQSEYVEFDMAYTIGAVRLTLDTLQLDLTPIDFLGETKLENGLYTYKITVVETPGYRTSLGFEFIED